MGGRLVKDIICINGIEYERHDYVKKFTEEQRKVQYLNAKNYIVYNKKDFEIIGMPKQKLGLKYIELNGKRYELYSNWFSFSVVKKPWFGQIALIRDNQNINVLNLNNGEIKFLNKIDEISRNHFVAYMPINKDFFVKYSDNNESIIGVGGYTLDSIEGHYRWFNNKEGKAEIERKEGVDYLKRKDAGVITEDELYERLNKVKEKQDIEVFRTKIKEIFECKEKINKLAEDICKSANKNDEFDLEK